MKSLASKLAPTLSIHIPYLNYKLAFTNFCLNYIYTFSMIQYLSTGKSCIHNYHICRACLGMQHIFSAGIHLEIFNINDELKNIERLMHYKIQEA